MLKPKSPRESFYGSYMHDCIVAVDHLLGKIDQVVDFSSTGQILNGRYNPNLADRVKIENAQPQFEAE